MRDAFVTYTREAGDLRLGWAGEWDIDDSRFQVLSVHPMTHIYLNVPQLLYAFD